jgi:SAM-dependent methyltransferase
MPNSPDQPVDTAHHWQEYWRGSHENPGLKGGISDPALTQFWERHLAVADNAAADIWLLDLACGRGAVTSHAYEFIPGVTSFAVDCAAAAMLELHKTHADTRCVAADAARLPFADGSFDYVCSQFGVEYAGTQAILGAEALLAPGGILAMILHLQDGVIHRECAKKLSGINTLRDSGLLPLARAAFEAAFALNMGRGGLAEYKAAEQALSPAIRQTQELMRTMGKDAAGGLADKLYQDIGYMYKHMREYELNDITQWLERMALELDSYAGRMASMIDAALAPEVIERLKQQLLDRGLELLEHEPIISQGAALPQAWGLVFRRPQ